LSVYKYHFKYMPSNEQGMNYVWGVGVDLCNVIVAFVIVESFLRILAERIDWDSAKSRDKNDRNATVSRRG